MRIIPAAAAGALLLTGIAAWPASAAPPSNDRYEGRDVIAALPFEVTLDTSEATTEAFDGEFSVNCSGIPFTDASVWYEYTPASTGAFIIDMSASDYSAGAVAATPDGAGGWMVESCGPGTIYAYGYEGTTVTIMVFDDQSDGGGNGGTLQMSVTGVPPAPTIDLTVNPKATFNAKTGEATVGGTYTCTPNDNAYTWASIDIQLRQKVLGHLRINGSGSTELACDGSQRPWSITVTGDIGMFKGGKAAEFTWWYACGEWDCSSGYSQTIVQLTGGRKR